MFYKFLNSEETLKMLQCMKLHYKQGPNAVVPLDVILECLWINKANNYFEKSRHMEHPQLEL